MKNDENSVNLSRRDFFKELGMIGGGGALLSAFPWLQSCSADDTPARNFTSRRGVFTP